jgi:Glycosyltransferase family 9 (heptosyltransferase)
VLEHTVFVGHDSGISHLAAAAGANCILLFGPSNPDVWAPRNKNVQVLNAPSGNVSDLEIEWVEAAVAAAVSRCFNENAHDRLVTISDHTCDAKLRQVSRPGVTP